MYWGVDQRAQVCKRKGTGRAWLYLRLSREQLIVFTRHVHIWALTYCLSNPSTGELRRNVARHPQRALNSGIHFSACKAIIFAAPSPSLLLGLLSQLTFIWRAAPSTETLLICPPFVRGKCSQTSQANFCSIARLGAPTGIGFKEEN